VLDRTDEITRRLRKPAIGRHQAADGTEAPTGAADALH
jgi:hypothetical protein